MAAYEQLHAEGFLVGKVGSGSYVAEIEAARKPHPAPRVVPNSPVARYAKRAREVFDDIIPGRQYKGLRYNLQYGLPLTNPTLTSAWRRALAQASAHAEMDYPDPQGLSILREQMRFDGIVFTDAMDMSAIARQHSAGEAAVRAIEAGADVILMPPDVGRAIEGIVDAVRSGRLSEERIDASVLRILETKESLGLHAQRFVPLERVGSLVGIPENTAIADEIAERSITLLQNRNNLLPLRGTRTGRSLARFPFGARITGRSIRDLLERGRVAPWAGERDLGVIAGDLPIGLGLLLGALPRPHDGVVTVEETRLEGATDHLVVPLSHTALLFSRAVARQVQHFLRDGRFV